VNLSRVSVRLGVLTCAVIASAYAVADDSGWYIGGNVGDSQAKIDNARIANGLAEQGFAVTSLSDDEHHFGYKVFGGYQFSRYFALEGGYFDLGKFGFNANTLPPGALAGNLKLNGANLDAVGILPFTQQFAAFARFGYDYADTKDNFAGYGAVVVQDPDRSEHTSNYKFGFGLQYAFSPSWRLRLEAERYRLNDAVGNQGDIDLYSLGVLYHFGVKAAPVAYVAPPPPPPEAPAPAPEAPPAPPIEAVMPEAPQIERYCSVLNIQFEIKRHNIERKDKEKLAVLGTFMTKYPETTTVIEGHTDNVGSAGDNMELSQRRADAVVTYLVDTLHVGPARLQAIGYGDTRPLADNSTEEGKRHNRRVDAVVECASDVEGLAVQPARVTMALRIDFGRDMDSVPPQYHGQLQAVASFLQANPSVTATVEGHTADGQANAQQAMQISQRRAQSVLDYLVANFGIAPARLSAEGFGNERRRAYNTSVEGQQENRSVSIIINYPRK
jgi:OmpA-OmpF porin, OOP family